tara:strand:+ start:491 stop:1195 length:705 start_codon:yes stop_codon:yes gene_type:complete
MNKIDFNQLTKSILVDENIFKPNLTSQLSYETSILQIKKNFNVLDLGCGCGIIGIALMKSIPNIKMHCSDFDANSVKNAKKNFIQHKLVADIRVGNLFDPWSDKKFDYIINDVSGISSVIAKNSPWFGKEVPCDSGEDGSNLTVSIIKKAKNYLTTKGLMQIPLISLSNMQKIVNVAKENFSDVKIVKSKDWFLPKEMESLKDKMNELKSKKYINFDEKFGKIICKTSIALCKN